VERQGGHPIRGTTVHAPLGSSLTGIFARASRAPFRATGLSVARRLLDQALVDTARRAGAELLERTAVQGVVRDGPTVTGLALRDAAGATRELSARLTIGADGLRSVVAVRWARCERPCGAMRSGNVADRARAIPPKCTRSGGYVGLNPLGGGIANVALVLPPADAGIRGRHDSFLEELASFPGVILVNPRNLAARCW
jgi:flavin-dependent dehydrogenase